MGQENQNGFRKDALARLNQYRRYPYTILISPAGYGKSHLLTLFANQCDATKIWIRLHKEDRSLHSFSRHFYQELSHTFPKGNWEELLNGVPLIIEQEDESERVVRTITDQLALYGEEVVLILDQMHMLEPFSEACRFIFQLIRNIPPNLHLIMATRSLPEDEAVKLLYQQNKVLEISEHHLLLSKEDLSALFHDYYRINLQDDEIEEIYSISEGWQALVHYIYLYLTRGGRLPELKEEPIYALRPFFDYIAEEILYTLPSTLQGFLKDISVMEEIDQTFLKEIFPGFDEQLIAQLDRYRLLSTSKQGKIGRLHPFLRHLLLDKTPPETKARMNRLLAYQYLRRKEYFLSFAHFIAAGEWEELALRLIQFGPTLIELGHLKRVIDTIHAIPLSYRKKYGRLSIVEGDYYRLHSDYDRALEKYKEAREVCRMQGDQEGETLAIEGEILVYLDTVQPNKADLLLKGDLRKARRAKPMLNNRLLHLIAENLVNIGKPRRAEKIFRLLRRLGQQVDPMVYSRFLLRTGKLKEANALLSKERRTNRAESSIRYGFRESSLVHSIVYAFLGEGEKAKKKAQQGILFASEMNSPFVEAVGWARMGHAILTYDIDQPHLAEESYLTSLQIFEEIGVARGPAEPLMGLTFLYAKSGKYDLSFSYGQRAVQLARSVSDLWIESLTKLGLGIASFYQGLKEQTVHYLEEAYMGGVQCSDLFLQTVSSLWLSLFYDLIGDSLKFGEWWNKAFILVREGEYDFFFTHTSFLGPKDPQMFIPLLIKTHEEGGDFSRDAGRILEKMGFQDLYFHPGYTLKVETLGHFRVFLGDRELSERDWQRSNAKRLFQYFLSHRNRELPKEMIQEELWPDMEEETVERDFKVALNALIKALEPERKARSSSYYILRQGSNYRLNLSTGIYLDVVEFEKTMEKGLRSSDMDTAIPLLEKGYALYKGDFLPDNLYDDWVNEERERLRLLFLKGSDRLAHLYLETGHFQGAISIAEKIVVIDPLWESAYRILMFAYHKLQNRTLSLRWYDRLTQVLMQELGVAPMEDSTLLYRKIIEGKEPEYPS